MHTTIRDLFAREQMRGKPAGAPVSLEDVQKQASDQEQLATMMPGQASIRPSSALPKHTVRSEPDRFPVDHAKKLHAFLKNAAGGPGNGFVTEDNDSHKIANTLARSGHLQHHGSRPGGKGGGRTEHWSMTPKGLAAIGHGAKGTQRPRR